MRLEGLAEGREDRMEATSELIYLVSRSSGDWMLKVQRREKIRIIPMFLAPMME